MRYGLFSMGEHPGRLARDAYDEDLREIVLADELGWDEVWIGEHHLNGKQEVLPTPEMLIAKAAARTSRIRMGPGVRLLALHYPLDVASDAAVADHMTDGRYNFGYGTGSALEFAFYGVPFAEAPTRLEESLDFIQQAWAQEGPFDWEGQHWQARNVYLWPLPLQGASLPRARACGSPSAWYATGRRGHWALASQFQTAERIAEGWAEYERGARDAGRTPDRRDLHVCRFCWIGDTDASARDTIRPWMDASVAYLHTQPSVRANFERLKPPGGSVDEVTFDYLCDIGLYVVGSPETVTRQLLRHAAPASRARPGADRPAPGDAPALRPRGRAGPDRPRRARGAARLSADSRGADRLQGERGPRLLLRSWWGENYE
jgi:alkanesulfonate monooxygenase SsuD/methylene tetrahydromethanopterin reductase-like flavin-dependent oxidoreductase (luciferase family)